MAPSHPCLLSGQGDREVRLGLSLQPGLVDQQIRERQEDQDFLCLQARQGDLILGVQVHLLHPLPQGNPGFPLVQDLREDLVALRHQKRDCRGDRGLRASQEYQHHLSVQGHHSTQDGQVLLGFQGNQDLPWHLEILFHLGIREVLEGRANRSLVLP